MGVAWRMPVAWQKLITCSGASKRVRSGMCVGQTPQGVHTLAIPQPLTKACSGRTGLHTQGSCQLAFLLEFPGPASTNPTHPPQMKTAARQAIFISAGGQLRCVMLMECKVALAAARASCACLLAICSPGN